MNKMNKRMLIRIAETLGLFILFFYPFRHVYVGIDMLDTGYNYANYTFAGLEHMDSMWFFATFLSTWIGHFFTLLPYGNTLLGMNLYTTLILAMILLTSYFFCTRVLKIPRLVTFLGEFIAASHCWAPTAVLYNYLTYFFFFLSNISLYYGLIKSKKIFLYIAGVLLGINLFVRFPNLAEIVLIIPVWYYAYACSHTDKEKGTRYGGLHKAFADTVICVSGYLSALVVGFLFIHFNYGFTEYISSIGRLFEMNDTAKEYQLFSMLTGIVAPYGYLLKEFYLLFVFLIVASIPVLLLKIAEFIYCKCNKTIKVSKTVYFASALWLTFIYIVMLDWMKRKRFITFVYTDYGCMFFPAIVFLLIALLVCLIQILKKGNSIEKKLFSMILICILLITPIGSNNSVYPILNNLFLIAPYIIWHTFRFVFFAFRKEKECATEQDKRSNLKITDCYKPLACGLGIVTTVFLVQSICFGVFFIYSGGKGYLQAKYTIENNEVLAHIRMNKKDAEWIQDFTDYVNCNELQGTEVISFDVGPGISYYFGLPSAFNPWCDLHSYTAEQMEKDMSKLRLRMNTKERERPIIVLSKFYSSYAESVMKNSQIELTEDELDKIMDPKWCLIFDFMQEQGYSKDLDTTIISVWR